MSASTPSRITRFDVGSVYLTHSGRRLRVTKLRSTHGRPVIYYVDEAAPTIEHYASFYTLQAAVESVLS